MLCVDVVMAFGLQHRTQAQLQLIGDVGIGLGTRGRGLEAGLGETRPSQHADKHHGVLAAAGLQHARHLVLRATLDVNLRR